MIETLFGSTTPLWMPVAPAGFGFPAAAPPGSAVMHDPLFGSFPAAGAVPGQSHLPTMPPPPAPFPQPSIPLLLSTVAMRRGLSRPPATDQEIEDFVYDAFELMPGASDVEIRCDAGRAMLTGSVQHKRLKRDLGEILWAIPTVSDVQNNLTIASRRRTRTASREDVPPAPAARKPA